MHYIIDDMRTGLRASRDEELEAREYARRRSEETGREHIIRVYYESGIGSTDPENVDVFALYHDGRSYDIPFNFATDHIHAREDRDVHHQRALDAEKKCRQLSGEVELYGRRVTDQLSERDEQLDEMGDLVEDLREHNATLRRDTENQRLQIAELEQELERALEGEREYIARYERMEENEEDMGNRIADLEGIRKMLIEERDAWRDRAEREIEKRLERDNKYHEAVSGGAKIAEERDEARRDLEDLRGELDLLRYEFGKYREYTQAGFATLYHEREFGPTAGAPRTEKLLDDMLLENDEGKPYARMVVYPLPPEERLEVSVDTTRFGKSMRAAQEYVDEILETIRGGATRTPTLNTYVAHGPTNLRGWHDVPFEISDEAWPEGAVGMAVYTDGIPTRVIPREEPPYEMHVNADPEIRLGCRHVPAVSGCPGFNKCGCTFRERRVGEDTIERQMERGTWE